MKVKELIKVFRTLDGDLDVKLFTYDKDADRWNEREELEILTMEGKVLISEPEEVEYENIF